MGRLTKLGRDVVVGASAGVASRAETLEGVAGALAIISQVTDRIDAAVMDASGDSLKLIANVAAGYDNIDVPAATARGIAVTNTPGVLHSATADLTMGLILDLGRRITEGDRFLRTGTPWTWGLDFFTGLDISAGATLGIIGLGEIGKAVARRALAFDMHVVATTRTARSDTPGVEIVDLDSLVGRADIVTIHCPLTPDTWHLFDMQRLSSMKPTALLVNTARGAIVDENALVEALESRRIAGAALDVFEHEPQVHRRLLELPNVVITPHIGSAGIVTRARMCELAVANVAALIEGTPLISPVRAA